METTPLTKGRIIGSALLIGGNCIGAGMLALPIFTGIGGFLPALCMFIVAWAFMSATGLLLLEVNLCLHVGANLVSMATRTFGRGGKIFTWVLWCFLFYLLLIAYIAGGGTLFCDLFENLGGISIPVGVCSTAFLIIFGTLIYFGTFVVDHLNRWLMLGLIVTYLLLIGFGASHINPSLLLRKEWGYTFFSLPVLTISFGFHNIIPSLVPYLHGKVDLLKRVILIGSSLPLIIYIAFEFVVLGIVPVDGPDSISTALVEGKSATDLLSHILGNTWMGHVASYFAFFALVTSFLVIALSFVHFLSDALQVKKKKKHESMRLCLLVLIPPYIIALVDPSLFLMALNYAGAIGAVTLFGVLPALMAWKCRYRFFETRHILLPGGKFLLVFIILFALLILSLGMGV